MDAKKIVPAALAEKGDSVICAGQIQTVTRVTVMPIGDDVVRMVHVTGGGVRRFSHSVGSRYRGVEIRGTHPDGVEFVPPPLPVRDLPPVVD